MTEQALREGIARLIKKRWYATGEELDRINAKLTKLYDLKALMIEQRISNER